MPLDNLLNLIAQATNQDFATIVPRYALQLSDEKIATISFCFWITHMAETDLGAVIQEAWQLTKQKEPVDNEALLQAFQEFVKGTERLNPDELTFYRQKIKVYETLIGENAHSSLHWKLNTIRNDLAHHRHDSLSYEGQSLDLVDTKRKLLSDYFTISLSEPDISKSQFLNTIPDDVRTELERLYPSLRRDN